MDCRHPVRQKSRRIAEGVDRKGRCGYFRLMSQEDAKRFREQADECRQQAATAVSLDAAEYGCGSRATG